MKYQLVVLGIVAANCAFCAWLDYRYRRMLRRHRDEWVRINEELNEGWKKFCEEQRDDYARTFRNRKSEIERN